MTRAEFDAACAEFESAYINRVTQMSGIRTHLDNEGVGGSANSKHLVGLARDYYVLAGAHEGGWCMQTKDPLDRYLRAHFPSHKFFKPGGERFRAGEALRVHVQGAPYAP